MSKPRPIGSDGLYESERKILDLYDAKLGPNQISVRCGISLPKVRDVISRLGNVSPVIDDRPEGSAMLLEAIQRTGRMHA